MRWHFIGFVVHSRWWARADSSAASSTPFPNGRDRVRSTYSEVVGWSAERWVSNHASGAAQTAASSRKIACGPS